MKLLAQLFGVIVNMVTWFYFFINKIVKNFGNIQNSHIEKADCNC